MYKHTHIYLDMGVYIYVYIIVNAKVPSSFSFPDPSLMSKAISGNLGDALKNPVLFQKT